MHEPARIGASKRVRDPANRGAMPQGVDTALFFLAAEYYRSLRNNESHATLRLLLKQIIDELEDQLFAEDNDLFEITCPDTGNTRSEALQLIADLEVLLAAWDVPHMTWVHALDGLIIRRTRRHLGRE